MDEESQRKKRIRELVESIGKSKSKKQKKVEEPSCDIPAGRHKTFKLNFGWLHQSEKSKKWTLVNVRKGGGLRTLDYPKEEPQTVSSLLTIGKNLFFPNGKNHLGNIEDMDISLSNHSGDEFQEFKDRNGTICSFQDFLKSYGFFSSQFYVYLKTSQKQVEKVSEEQDHQRKNQGHKDSLCYFTVNGIKPHEIKIRYTRKSHSAYSGCPISISCYSMRQCLEISCDRVLTEDAQSYNALDDGFKVSLVEIDNKIFLSQEDGVLTFPQCMNVENEILHAPLEIFGFERDDPSRLLLGIITKYHNTDKCLFTWYKNGDVLCSGSSKCILAISDEGIYTATVSINDKLYTFDTFVDIKNTCSVPSPIALVQQPHESSELVLADTRTDQEPSSFQSHLKGIQTCSSPTPTALVQQSYVSSDPLLADTRIDQEPSSFQSPVEGIQTCSSPTLTALMQQSQISSDPVLADTRIDQEPSSFQSPVEGIQTCSSPTLTALMQQSQISSDPVLADTRIDQEPSTFQSPIKGIQTCSSPTLTALMQQSQISSDPVLADTRVDKEHHLKRIQTGSAPTPTAFVPQSHVSSELVLADTRIDEEHHLKRIQTYSAPTPTALVPQSHVSSELVLADTRIDQQLSSFQSPSKGIQTCSALTPSTLVQQSHFFSEPVLADSRTNQQYSSFEFSEKGIQTCSVPTPTTSLQQSVISAGGPVLTDTKLGTDSKSVFKSPKTSEEDLVDVKDLNLLSKIGEGAFGEVFCGTWLGTKVAIKRIKVKRMKLAKSMILREVKVHQHIRHPNIILFMCYAVSVDSFYIVSEMVCGSNLDDLIFGESEPGTLTIANKAYIAGEICKAVTYLHKKEIIHRDIKPENILISKNVDIVKLCDLGVSKMTLANTLITTVSSGGSTNPGTPVYQAPELLIGDSEASSSTDIWSFSCTLAEMFSEEPIWPIDVCDNPLTIIKACMLRKEKPNGLTKLEMVKDVRKEWIEITRSGINYEAADRPSAYEMMKVFID